MVICEINRIKYKNHIITLTDKKIIDTIQHSLMVKVLDKLGIKTMYFNTMRAMYENHMGNIIVIYTMLKVFLQYQE
jgi:hypothetical protein